MRIQHLVKDVAGLELAVARGFRYYRTRCNQTALLAQLHPASNRDAVDCGSCLSIEEAEQGRPAEAQPPGPPPVVGAVPADEVADLSDFDAIEEEIDDASFAVPEVPRRAESGAPYPLPDPMPTAEICARLGKDPATDPKGKIGNLDVDIRTVLSDGERQAADLILGMVGGIPMADSLVQTVYRLCHRLAWYESAPGGRSAAEE